MIDAFDIHVHVRTGERRNTASSQWKHAQQLFGSGSSGSQDSKDDDLIEYYASRNMRAVVFDVDSSSSTGERCDNDAIADLVNRSNGTLVGFCAVDPPTGAAAVREAQRCHALGFRGMKVQPVSQGFYLNDRRYFPLWEFAQEVGWPVMVHTGTTGIGAGMPGGGGIRLDCGRPVPYLDDVAASFPRLQLIAAHFGWPWHLELLAAARHKQNIWIDLSGWSPRYLPPEVIQYCNSVIPDKFLFGSDWPLLTPDRWLADFASLSLKESVIPMVLRDNALRLLEIHDDKEMN